MKRKKYVPYDYEETYREKLAEEEIRKAPAGSIYALKEIRAGTQLEVEIFPEFRRRSDIPPEGRKPRKDNSTAQRDLNERNARKTLERLVNANFKEGDLWITLTYDEEHLPETMEEAVRNMQKYMQRINYQRKKRGLPPARYIYVTEHNEDTEVRWHHHIIMDGAMDRDTVESCWKLRTRNTVRKIVPDEDGLTGMAKYVTKEGYTRKKYERRWNASKGLRKPEVKKMLTKRPEGRQRSAARLIRAYVNRMLRDRGEIEQICRKWYPDYAFTGAQIYYNQWNGQYYIKARLRRVKNGTENQDDRPRKHLPSPGQPAEGSRGPDGAGRQHRKERNHAKPDGHAGTL